MSVCFSYKAKTCAKELKQTFPRFDANTELLLISDFIASVLINQPEGGDQSRLEKNVPL